MVPAAKHVAEMVVGRQRVAQERRTVLRHQRIVQAQRTDLEPRPIAPANQITTALARRRIIAEPGTIVLARRRTIVRQTMRNVRVRRRALRIRIARQIVVKPRHGLKIQTSPASQIEV